MQDYLKEAIQSRASVLEAAIKRFYECGVTLDRMEIVEHRDRPLESVLYVDGIPRFTWRVTGYDGLWPMITRTQR